jgi:hypothetical protein
VAAILVGPSSAELAIGKSQYMTAVAFDSAGNEIGVRNVHWSTTNDEAVAVSGDGNVTGRRVGSAFVVAESDGLRDSAIVTVTPTAITSPLRISKSNPRYFTDNSGRAIYLTGAHTWENFQDVRLNDAEKPFDWPRYLDFLVRHNHNFTELWRWEQAKWIAGFDSSFTYLPMPYRRTGPGFALDGKPKFDLNSFDTSYFTRMRERVDEARRRGIYVSIMLFDGWSIEKKGFPHGNPWRGHPFNRDNNVNGIDGDPDHDDQGLETHTLAIPAIVALQDAYVRRVIDAVWDLDNVLYEISNETTSGASYVEWQKHIITVIKSYEAKKGIHHPVGMTALYPNGNDTDLFQSDADFVSPATKLGVGDTWPASGKKVLLWDTDHLCGNCGDGPWVWRSFTRGVNPVFMDVYDGAYPVTMLPKPEDPRWESARKSMGYTLAYANRMDLASMAPHPEVCSSRYCLAGGVSGHSEYLVYLNGAKSARVNLTGISGLVAAEWFDPEQGRAFAAGKIRGGGPRTFTAPDGAQVLYLKEIGAASQTAAARVP